MATYKEYHAAVMSAVRDEMYRRWPPKTEAETKMLDANIAFLDGCTFDEGFAEQTDPIEEAREQIEAAIDSQ